MAANSPLSGLANQRVRFVFRPTQVYGNLFKQTLQSKFLKNGVDRSIALDVLSRSLLKSDTKPESWVITAVEQQALAQLDISLFATNSNSDALPIEGNHTIEKYFTQPSYDLVIARLQKLNQKDLAQQISFIHSSLYARAANITDRSSVSQPSTVNLSAVFSLTQETLVQQAVNIALLVMKPGSNFQKGGKKINIVSALNKRLKNSRATILFCLLAGLLLTIPRLAVPAFSQIFVDEILVQDRQQWLRPLLIGMVLSAVFRMLLAQLQFTYLRRLMVKLSVSMSGQFLWYILRLPIGFYA